MTSKKIRQTFIDFFCAKQHDVVPSAPLVVKDDPTLMFNNAGMNQFKDIFLGNKRATHQRVVNTQKCLRVSGKHNDLEEVGLDGYHHTFFEMLGNWSFGDYFKEEAIAWAWELLTTVYRLDEDRLYVTVFGGDAEDKLNDDDEAKQIWSKYIQPHRILEASKKDNFWEMGEVGPCGPCSEIHIDIRSDDERKEIEGSLLVNKDHPLVIEIWNLVFIQYNRQRDGQLKILPQQHVDTGLGLERLCMVIQGHSNSYDTDLFIPMTEKIKEITGTSIPDKAFKSEACEAYDKKIIAIRVIADHIRAIVFSIADGLLPSNNKAGYVIRRILRRAVRYGFTFLNQKEPFLYQLVPVLSESFADVFPEVKNQSAFIQKILKQEEQAFLKTLDRGLHVLDEFFLTSEEKKITGNEAFELYDTFGFPLDLTLLIANEKGFSVDEKGFYQAMEKQKLRSKKSAVQVTGDWHTVSEDTFQGFIGYDALHNCTKILKYRLLDTRGEKENDKNVQVILHTTPFYAESGGQVGDKGYLIVGKERISVLDTKKENDSYIHHINQLPKEVTQEVITQVDEQNRQNACANHSATHLLHAALKQVLGKHIEQKGSLVNAHELRFDFNHFEKLSKETLDKINHLVNQKIFEHIPLDEKRNIPLVEAKKMGATALFGEKYGDNVRVITFDSDYSVELCGGTHVKNTAEIGMFQITSEGSVAAGVRRITAVSQKGALEYFNNLYQELELLKSLFRYPKSLVQSVKNLQDEFKEKQKELAQLFLEQQNTQKQILTNRFIDIKGIPVLIEKINVSNNDIMKNIIHSLAQEKKEAIIILCATVNGKPSLMIWVDKKWVENKKIYANLLIKEWSPLIKGGGGGQPFLATAGGKDIGGIERVISTAVKWRDEILSNP